MLLAIVQYFKHILDGFCSAIEEIDTVSTSNSCSKSCIFAYNDLSQFGPIFFLCALLSLLRFLFSLFAYVPCLFVQCSDATCIYVTWRFCHLDLLSDNFFCCHLYSVCTVHTLNLLGIVMF